MTINRVVVACLAAVLGTSAQAVAQSDNPANAGVQYDFSLPGARSLALGGAFVGVADDATAAWANPAGLVVLTRPEVSVEGRARQLGNASVERGHAFGNASGVGFDTITGLTEATFKDWSGGAAFVSFVFPMKRLAVAGFRHELQNFKAPVESDGVFIGKASGAIDRAQPYSGDLTINVVNYGGSLAARIGGGISAGVTIVLSDFRLDSQTNQYTYTPFNPPVAPAPSPALGGVGQYYGSPDFSTSNIYTATTETGDDRAAAVSVGVLWRHPTDKTSLGFAYRAAPTFTYQAMTVFGSGVARAGRPALQGAVADVEDIQYSVPNVASAGGSYRPLEQLLLSAEYDRVQYSRLSDHLAEIFGVEEAQPEVGRLIRQSLFFDDANQLRFGAEYSVVRAPATVAVRFGIWNDPDHRLQFNREALTAAQRDQLGRIDVRYLPGENVVHWTPGVGVAMRRVQFDGAFDMSSTVKTISVSTVVRF